VDDERSVRGLLTDILKLQGHQIATASNGIDGLDAYRKAWDAGTPYDLVISDREMPGMGGAEMVRQIKKINPEAKVIFITGYSDEKHLIPLREADPSAVILAKPVELKTIIRTVEEALAACGI
jgi:CheY-like chemotaxis protein